MIEIWKDIIGFEGKYQISNAGNIKSSARIIGHGKGYLKPESILPFHRNSDNYKIIHLCCENRKKQTKQVHRLVASHFIKSDLLATDIVCHYDGDIENNHVSNLYVGDVTTNTLDKYRHGSTKLTEGEIQEIKSLIGTMSQAAIGKKFGVQQSYISRIKTGIRAVVFK